MIKIINNFAELLHNQRLSDKAFNKLINISYLNNDELLKIDQCIENILTIYPKLYPKISDSKENKHRYDKVERQNKKYEEIFIRHLEEKDYRQAAKVFSMMSHIRIDQKDSIKLFEDSKYTELFHGLNNELAHLKTRDEIKKEIREYLEHSIGQMIADQLILDNLTKYLIKEICLRLKVPDEYDLDNFTKFEFLHDKLEILERKNYLDEIIQLNKEQKSALEILKTLKLKYKIGSITNKLL